MSELWTPAEITTALWLDAADSATVAVDGSGDVVQWDDKSGNARDATDSATSGRPSLVLWPLKTALNAIDCKGQSGLTCVGFPSVDTSQPHVYAVVAKTQAIPVSHYLLTQTFAGGSSRETALFESVSSFGLSNQTAFGPRPSGSDAFYARAAFSTDERIIIGTAQVGTNALRINGLQVDSRSTTLVNNSTDALNIGQRASGRVFDGLISEVVVLGYSDAQAIEKLEGYLAHKWGLAGNLPAEHPYKSAAPVITP